MLSDAVCEFMCDHIICQCEAVSIPVYHLFARPEGIGISDIIMDGGDHRHVVIINAIAIMIGLIKTVCAEGIFMCCLCMGIAGSAGWVALIT